MSVLTESPAWRALAAHSDAMLAVRVRDLFASDAGRFERFSLELGDALVDYSKNRVTEETMKLLFDLARQARVFEWRDRMFAGEKINRTEDRAVLHVALRNRSNRPIVVDGKDVMPEVNAVLAKMREFTTAVRSGAWKGHTGKRITDIVNIGIGGSDLGPAMASLALKPYWQPGMRAHFVSNVDGTQIVEALKEVNPEQTLFVVESKTFTTQETLMNARSARAWLVEKLGSRGRGPQALRGGLHRDRRGREVRDRSRRTCSASGTGSAVATRSGAPSGCRSHCSSAWTRSRRCSRAATRSTSTSVRRPSRRTSRSSWGCSAIWYSNFFGASTHAILPYDQYMSRFAAYFQQGDMESNGKRVTRDGRFIEDYTTGPIVWGEPGTNGQHAFYQLLHQGTRLVPCDFLAPLETHNPLGHHHEVLLANYFAQTEALMRGKTPDEARAELEAQKLSPARVAELTPHKTFPGNRPTTSILFTKLTPKTLGMLDRHVRAQDLRPGDRLGDLQLRSVGRGARQAAREEDRAGARGQGRRDLARRIDQRAHQPLQASLRARVAACTGAPRARLVRPLTDRRRRRPRGRRRRRSIGPGNNPRREWSATRRR